MSDHGHAFLSDDQNPISIGRTKVPWMIRGGNTPQYNSFELTENIDFFNGILKCSDLKINHNNNESNCPTALGGKKNREFVLSQSIYPGQTYKAIIRDKAFEYEFESIMPVTSSGNIIGEAVCKKKSSSWEVDKKF